MSAGQVYTTNFKKSLKKMLEYFVERNFNKGCIEINNKIINECIKNGYFFCQGWTISLSDVMFNLENNLPRGHYKQYLDCKFNGDNTIYSVSYKDFCRYKK